MSTYNLEGNFTDAVALYRSGEFERATKKFQEIVDMAPDFWDGRLYLAMACFKAGRSFEAQTQMNYIKENCPDPEVRLRAERSQKYMTVELPKPNVVTPPQGGSARVTGQIAKPSLIPPPGVATPGGSARVTGQIAKPSLTQPGTMVGKAAKEDDGSELEVIQNDWDQRRFT